MKYYVITNECTNCPLIFNNREYPETHYPDLQVNELPLDYKDNGNYIVVNGELVKNPNYEEEQAQKEKERIKMLSCTKRDFALLLQEYGVSYTQLKTLVASSEQAQLEWDLCERLYRFNPLLDVMAGQLGITSEQLDMIFKTANGENSVL